MGLAQRRRTTNAVALQFRHSATWDSARRVTSKASTAILTSSAALPVTRLRHDKQMNLGLYAARKASISPGMVNEDARRRRCRQHRGPRAVLMGRRTVAITSHSCSGSTGLSSLRANGAAASLAS